VQRRVLGADARTVPGSRVVGDDGVEYSVLATSDPMTDSPPFTPDEDTSTGATMDSVLPDVRRERFDHDRNQYLENVVAARARDCWTKLEGNGTIELLYLMRHETGRGVGALTPTTDIGIQTPVSVVASELTPEQSKRALDCMLDAVDGTSFTTELPDESLGPLVGMYQVWRVGKPPDSK
jgi:hypothetical protein